MMASRLAWVFLGLAVTTGPAGAAAPDAATRARIEQAYARKLDAAASAAIDQRIASQWPALIGDAASPVIGNPKGDAIIVEFFDYACPYCKAAEPRLEALLKADRKVKLVLKEFPILTPESMIATRAALAAVRQGKYHQFHQALMRFEGRLTEAGIFDTARRTGLDLARLRTDMQAPAVTDEIIANFNLARAIRAFQTPAFIAGNAAGGHALSSQSATIDFPKAVAAVRGK